MSNFYDRIINKIKDHKIIAIIIIVLLVIGFFLTFFNNFFNLYDKFFPQKDVNNSSSTLSNINSAENKQIPEEPVLIKLTYKPSKLTDDDQCDDKSCVGIYTKIGEDNLECRRKKTL